MDKNNWTMLGTIFAVFTLILMYLDSTGYFEYPVMAKIILKSSGSFCPESLPFRENTNPSLSLKYKNTGDKDSVFKVNVTSNQLVFENNTVMWLVEADKEQQFDFKIIGRINFKEENITITYQAAYSDGHDSKKWISSPLGDCLYVLDTKITWPITYVLA